MDKTTGRLTRVVLEGEPLHRISPLQAVDREQAVRDLQAENEFFLASRPELQSIPHLSLQEGRLIFDIRDAEDVPVLTVMLALSPFKALIKDYQMLLESYSSAVAEGREA